MKIKAVILDMDGLMFDTERQWLEAVRECNKIYSFNVPDELIIRLMGCHLNQINSTLRQEMGEEFDIEFFTNTYDNYMNEKNKINGPRIKKGLVELLSFLKKNDIKIGIASSNFLNTILTLIKQSKIGIDYFDCIVSGDMVSNPKPNSEIYLTCCQKLGVTPENALALEDSQSGLISATNANIKTIWIPDMTSPSKEVLEKIYAKCDSLLDVIQIIKQLN